MRLSSVNYNRLLLFHGGNMSSNLLQRQLSKAARASELGGQTLARLHEEYIAHDAHKGFDWVESALFLLGYAVYHETQ